jgi:hypothetical protein
MVRPGARELAAPGAAAVGRPATRCWGSLSDPEGSAPRRGGRPARLGSDKAIPRVLFGPSRIEDRA